MADSSQATRTENGVESTLKRASSSPSTSLPPSDSHGSPHKRIKLTELDEAHQEPGQLQEASSSSSLTEISLSGTNSPLPSPPRAPLHPSMMEEEGAIPEEDVKGSFSDEAEPGELDENEEDPGLEGNISDASEAVAAGPSTVESSRFSPMTPEVSRSQVNTPNNALNRTSPGAQKQDKKSQRVFTGCSQFEDYEVMTKIGEGTFGEVSTYRHKKSGQVFALKKILMHNEKEGIPITALREIKILKSLRHDNIVSLTEMAFARGDRSARARGSVYMVFPYLDHDLTGLLENPQVRLSMPHIKSYLQQLLRGTDYLHKNKILHRDMKGSNILIDNRGNLKLADFGLARSYTPEKPDSSYTNLVVTRWYRPPELLLGATKYGSSVDMWGVGCVFGEMLKRRPILTGSSDLDQVDRIFQLCGSPNEDNWPGHKDLPSFNSTIASMKSTYKRSVCERFAQFDGAAVDLIDCLLKLCPERRLTAEQALGHAWFMNHPLPARPGTRDFIEFPSSHEYTTRKARQEANKADASSRPREGGQGSYRPHHGNQGGNQNRYHHQQNRPHRPRYQNGNNRSQNYHKGPNY